MLEDYFAYIVLDWTKKVSRYCTRTTDLQDFQSDQVDQYHLNVPERKSKKERGDTRLLRDQMTAEGACNYGANYEPGLHYYQEFHVHREVRAVPKQKLAHPV